MYLANDLPNKLAFDLSSAEMMIDDNAYSDNDGAGTGSGAGAGGG